MSGMRSKKCLPGRGRGPARHLPWPANRGSARPRCSATRPSGPRGCGCCGPEGSSQRRRFRSAPCWNCSAPPSACSTRSPNRRRSRELGIHLHEIWATAALGDLELGLGDAARAAVHYEQQQRLLAELAITDADLSPAVELAEAYARLGRDDDAREVASAFAAAAQAKGQPWPLARALRSQGLLATDADFPALFDQAIRQHAQTPDAFETARTRLAYGERLRRARNRVLAREQLRAAL